MRINYESEQNLISILLNNPADADFVDLADDDFLSDDNRAVYKAIKDDPSAIIDFFGKAKQNGYSGDHRLFEQLKDGYINDRNLQLHVKAVKRNKFEIKFMNDVEKWKDNPFTETMHSMQESLNEIELINRDEHDGNIDEDLADIYQSTFEKRPTGIKTYKTLDNLFGGGLYDGMLFSIGARPAVGKSAFAVNLATKIINRNEGVHIDLFTLEMSKREVLIRFLANSTGISSTRIKVPNNDFKPINDNERQSMAKAMDYLSSAGLQIYDQHHELSDILSQIKTTASRCKHQKYVAIVDYIGLIQVSGRKERYLQIGEITRGLKRIATKYEIPIIALTQLNRGIESRQENEPNLSDIRESGDVEQDSNVVGFLYNPEQPEDLPRNQRVVRFSVKKNREGATGNFNLIFEPKKMTMVEVSG